MLYISCLYVIYLFILTKLCSALSHCSGPPCFTCPLMLSRQSLFLEVSPEFLTGWNRCSR